MGKATVSRSLFLVCLAFFSANFVAGYRVDRNNLRGTNAQLHRPVMHTFFSQLTPVGKNGKSAGMTGNAHSRMLSTWRDSWQKAGWDTRVLTMEDAKLHPDFAQLDAEILKFKMNEYEKMCYYRWLAMAAVGGGWMSDYDALPLNDFVHQGFDLPFQGALTSYEMHVPSLISGSANEWLRMTRRLVEYANAHTMPNGETPSDMFSLLGLKEKYPSMFIALFQVAGQDSSPKGDMWTAELCQQKTPRQMRAIHFSHAMIDQDWIPGHPEDSFDDRPVIARRWLENWLNGCGRQQMQEK